MTNRRRLREILCLRCSARHRHLPKRCRCGACPWADYEQFLAVPSVRR